MEQRLLKYTQLPSVLISPLVLGCILHVVQSLRNSCYVIACELSKLCSHLQFWWSGTGEIAGYKKPGDCNFLVIERATTVSI